jgi:hypothetical protein
MNQGRSAQETQDIIKLRAVVSRLHALSVTNLGTVLNLSSALLKVPGLPDDAALEARAAFDSIQQQIDVLAELAELAETNNGR